MAIAIYARKSVEREGSISCETQIEHCKAMIKPEEKNEKVLEFVDNGFSGGNMDREAFQKMMRKVEHGEISKIIVYRLDRISRSLPDFVTILETIKEYNVAFVSSQETFDTSSSYGEMLVKMLMVFAEFERTSIIERVTQAYLSRSEKGLYMGGRRPYGFNLKPEVIYGIKSKIYVQSPLEAEQVKYIFESYAVEGVSLRRLMDNLIQNGIKPLVGEWSTAKISAIIKNPIYVRADNSIYDYYKRQNADVISAPSDFDGVHGVQLYGKTKHSADDLSDIRVIVMQHEGFIPADLWLKCQRRITKNKQIGNALSNATSWLGGKLVCAKCGHTMTCTKGGERADGTRTRYFSCTGKSHKRSCTGIRVPIYADSMEDMVYSLIADKLSTLKQYRKKISTDNSNKINILRNKIAEIDVKIDNLLDAVENGESKDAIATFNSRIEKRKHERNELAQQIAELESMDSEVINIMDIAKKWKAAKYDERKAVCGLLIDKIYIHEDGTAEVDWII